MSPIEKYFTLIKNTCSKKCKNCIHSNEAIISDGKGTIKLYCRKIRGQRDDEEFFDGYEENLNVTKRKIACEFYEE